MTVKKISAPQGRAVFRGIFEGFLNSLGLDGDTDADRYDLVKSDKPVERAMALDRIYQQIYMGLRDRDEYAYPLSLYVEDNSFFCTVAQGGMIFQVPLTVSKDAVTMGEWVRVEETFTPVEQSFRVRRDKNGKYRWTCIAGTTVLNRVGEIDSSELFDSFIEHAERTGEYPRLDFYHHGEKNPEAWEFGTADLLMREGVCYIASGTFDEGHPLAVATIRACERDGDVWGNSIEFRASVKSELIVANPEVKVAVYKRGINTRISVVLEEDAAGLFTLYGIKEGVTQTMDAKAREKLKLLYGDDEAGLQAFLDKFEESVDGVNRTVKDDNLIHRAKEDTKTAKVADPVALEDAEPEADETEDEEDEDGLTIEEIVAEVVQSKEILSIAQGVADLKKMMGDLIVERENEKKEIARLNSQVTDLSKDDDEKMQTRLQDLPRSKRTVVTHRPRGMNEALEGDKPQSMDTIANRTLSGIPSASRY
jgi:hypothetical protein